MARHYQPDIPQPLLVPKKRRKPVDLRVSRNPYEVCIMVSFLFSALTAGLFGTSPTSIFSNFPPQVKVGIGVVIVLGAIIVIIGIFTPDDMTSAFVEIAGQFGITGPLVLYVSNLASNIEVTPGAFGAIALVGVLFGSLWRIIQIGLWIRWTVSETHRVLALQAIARRDRVEDGE